MSGSIAVILLCVIATAVYAIALYVPAEYHDIAFLSVGGLLNVLTQHFITG